MKLTFSRALTSTTVLVSRAMRLSLMDLATSCGVLGLETLKNENDMMIMIASLSLSLYPLSPCRCWDEKEMLLLDAVLLLLFLLRFQLLVGLIMIYVSPSSTIMNQIIKEIAISIASYSGRVIFYFLSIFVSFPFLQLGLNYRP